MLPPVLGDKCCYELLCAQTGLNLGMLACVLFTKSVPEGGLGVTVAFVVETQHLSGTPGTGVSLLVLSLCFSACVTWSLETRGTKVNKPSITSERLTA